MIVKEIRVLREAGNDLEVGRLFYENQAPGIGDYFLDSLISDIESLVIYAGVHLIEHGYHRMLSKRFPFAIYYEVKDESVYVVAVLLTHRNPSWIKRLMKNRN